jgi:hypothetical protein
MDQQHSRQLQCSFSMTTHITAHLLQAVPAETWSDTVVLVLFALGCTYFLTGKYCRIWNGTPSPSPASPRPCKALIWILIDEMFCIPASTAVRWPVKEGKSSPDRLRTTQPTTLFLQPKTPKPLSTQQIWHSYTSKIVPWANKVRQYEDHIVPMWNLNHFLNQHSRSSQASNRRRASSMFCVLSFSLLRCRSSSCLWIFLRRCRSYIQHLMTIQDTAIMNALRVSQLKD